MMQKPKIVVDAMLGRLGKKLRMLGFDTELADSSWSDIQIMDEALHTNRILLTRDLPFFRLMSKKLVELNREPNQVQFIASQILHEQLAIFLQQMEINPADFIWKNPQEIPFETRCPKCNTKLSQVNKNEVLNRILSGTAEHYDKYWECLNPTCHQVYWIGRHFNKLMEELQKIKRIKL